MCSARTAVAKLNYASESVEWSCRWLRWWCAEGPQGNRKMYIILQSAHNGRWLHDARSEFDYYCIHFFLIVFMRLMTTGPFFFFAIIVRTSCHPSLGGCSAERCLVSQKSHPFGNCGAELGIISPSIYTHSTRPTVSINRCSCIALGKKPPIQLHTHFNGKKRWDERASTIKDISRSIENNRNLYLCVSPPLFLSFSAADLINYKQLILNFKLLHASGFCHRRRRRLVRSVAHSTAQHFIQTPFMVMPCHTRLAHISCMPCNAPSPV